MPMRIQVLAFGIAREIIGKQLVEVSFSGHPDTDALMQHLKETYPALNKLASLAIAVNSTYVKQAVPLQEGDEVALIPPVSGG
jgi:molybdopterin synthase sulfur carrier subunit